MIKGHGGTKTLYNDIVEFIFEWSTLHPGIFVRKPGVPKWDRKRVLEHIGDVFQTTELITENHDIISYQTTELLQFLSPIGRRLLGIF